MWKGRKSGFVSESVLSESSSLSVSVMIPNNQFHEKFREIDFTEKKIPRSPTSCTCLSVISLMLCAIQCLTISSKRSVECKEVWRSYHKIFKNGGGAPPPRANSV